MKNFKDLIKEIKKENKQELVKKQKSMSFDFSQPFNKKKLDEINTINKINEIIKYRDLPMEKVSYEHWLKVLQNKMVEELDPRYAKKLYEQDMSRVEKYNALSNKSGGGRNRVAVTVEEPWTPARLATGDKDYWWNPDSITGLSDGDSMSSFTDSAQGYTLTEGTAGEQPTYKDANYVWSGTGATEKKSAAVVSVLDGPADGFIENTIPLELTSGVLEITYAFVVHIPLVNAQWMVNTWIGESDISKRFGVGVNKNYIRLGFPGGYIDYNPGGHIVADGDLIVIIVTASGGTVKMEAIPGVMSSALTDTYTPTTVPTGVSSMMRSQASDPIAFGETLLLSRAITSEEIAQLKAYWADKYGAP